MVNRHSPFNRFNRFFASLAAITIAGALLAAQGGSAGTAQPAAPSGAPAAAQPAGPDARPGGTSENPPVTFRVQVDYVEVDALVTDANGNPVKDLRREDFEILEDKVPQKIDMFSFFDVPVTRPDQPLFSPTPIERDVQTNQPLDGRLYVMLLDDLHTYPLRTPLVKKAARQFIEGHMGANDIMAVVHLSGRSDAAQEFTSNKRLLLEAVDKFMGRKLPSPTFSRLDSYNTQQSFATLPDASQPYSQIEDPNDSERGFNARTALESIE